VVYFGCSDIYKRVQTQKEAEENVPGLRSRNVSGLGMRLGGPQGKKQESARFGLNCLISERKKGVEPAKPFGIQNLDHRAN
jgi:hypothetical protein